MRAIFQPKEDRKTEIFTKIAKKYNTEVKEDNEQLFVMAKPKLLIAEKEIEGKFYIYVWGASQEDMRTLRQIIGEPTKIIEEKPSPEEFATNLTMIPEIEKKSKEEIIELLQMDQKDLKRYKSLIGLLAKRKGDKKFIQADKILKKL